MILDRVLEVLACAHDKGIAHRDIKPHNVFCTRSGDVKVLDFGIAVLREKRGEEPEGDTVSGTLLGTPSYMAPEQARGRWAEVDHSTDLWATGATSFTLLTGRHVHRADTRSELLIAAATQAAPSLREFRPDLPDSVIECVDRALEPNKAARFSDARAMQRAIGAALSELTGGRQSSSSVRAANGETTASEVSTTVPPPTLLVLRPRRHGRWLAATVTSLVFGTTLAASRPDTAHSAGNARRERITASPPAVPDRSGAAKASFPIGAVAIAPTTSSGSSAKNARQERPKASRVRRLELKPESTSAPADTESALDRWN